MANLLPWQGQLIVPLRTSATGQPWWVHTALNARKTFFLGRVTTYLSSMTTPPPTGMSRVRAITGPGAASAASGPEPAGEADGVAPAGRTQAATWARTAAAPVRADGRRLRDVWSRTCVLLDRVNQPGTRPVHANEGWGPSAQYSNRP